MFESLATALAAGLSIWQSHDKARFANKLADLRKAYHDEYNKDLAVRSDAVLDGIEFELCLLSASWSSAVGEPNAAPQPGPAGV